MNTNITAAGARQVNRRSMLGAIGVVAVSSLPAMAGASERQGAAEEVSPELLQLIERRNATHARFDQVCNCCDHIKLGREPTAAEERKWRRADRAERRALAAICEYRPRSLADCRAKAAHLLEHQDWMSGFLTEENADAFLASMAGAS
jgi:hypothetical protein